MDIAFLVDVSSSICAGSRYDRDGECEAFKLQKSFIEGLMTNILQDDSTTGMISWATQVFELYPFEEHFGVETNLAAMDEMLQYAEGSTMTGAMTSQYLQYLAPAQEQRFGRVVGSPWSFDRKQVIIMITDGVPTDDACAHALEFEEATRGKFIYAVKISKFDVPLALPAIQEKLKNL